MEVCTWSNKFQSFYGGQVFLQDKIGQYAACRGSFENWNFKMNLKQNGGLEGKKKRLCPINFRLLVSPTLFN